MLVSPLKMLSGKIIFCFHRVIPENLANQQVVHRALYITPESFEYIIRCLLKIGKVVELHEIFQEEGGNRFLITFDDGWKDNYIYAFPILKKYGVRAVIFICTNNIDQRKMFWTEELGMRVGCSLKVMRSNEVIKILKGFVALLSTYPCVRNNVRIDQRVSNIYYILDRLIESLKLVPPKTRNEILYSLYNDLNVLHMEFGEANLLSWDEIIKMANWGIMFGSHTHSHCLLDRTDDITIEEELRRSKRILESKIEREVNTF